MSDKNDHTKKLGQNVLAELVLCIQVHTGGDDDGILNIPDKEVGTFIRDNPDAIVNAVESINNSEEYANAVSVLYSAAAMHRQKYPKSRILFTPMRALKKPEYI